MKTPSSLFRWKWRKGRWGAVFFATHLFGLVPVGLVLFGLSIIGQLLRWRAIEGEWAFSAAGTVIAMWLFRIGGHERPEGRPNVVLAIVIVALEIILLLVARSLWEPRHEAAALTPPSGDS